MRRTDHPFVSITEDSLVLNIYVQPRASKTELCGILGDTIKIRLTSPPLDGAANKLCREFLAGVFDVPKSAVEIIAGETSRLKRVRIKDSNPKRLRTIIDKI